MAEIERDLVRWRRGRWVAVVTVLLALQVGTLFWGSRGKVLVREIYPREPKVALAEGSRNPDWVELQVQIEDPFLFVAASWNGFSSEAWLRKPEWKAPGAEGRLPPRFLSLPEARKASPVVAETEAFAFLERQKPKAAFPEPREAPRPARGSELRVVGPRRLMNALAIPPQFHTDVLSNTVVEALVSADGLVISSRVVENSGSARADADALALARSARFGPKSGENQAPDRGKLIFQWYALNLSATNRSAGSTNTSSTNRAR